jgi:hypothetical protein
MKLETIPAKAGIFLEAVSTPPVRVYAFFYTALGRSGPGRAAIKQFVGIRFSAVGGSGFGCQETEVLNPDT